MSEKTSVESCKATHTEQGVGMHIRHTQNEDDERSYVCRLWVTGEARLADMCAQNKRTKHTIINHGTQQANNCSRTERENVDKFAPSLPMLMVRISFVSTLMCTTGRPNLEAVCTT